MLISALIALVTAQPASAAPRIWLQYTDLPTALMASNDSGAEVKGCQAAWTIKWDRDRHFTEIAMVDLPAKGEAKVSDCHDWWNPAWSKTMDVSVTLSGPDGKVLAKESYEGIFKLVARQGIPTDGWTATAKRGGNPAAAFDNDLATRWDTGGKQESGDWYLLDMGKPQRVAGLVLDARQSAQDYPGGLAVFTSEDGVKWTRLMEAGDTEPINQGGRLRFDFEPVSARYIYLVLAKPHGDSWFWSIHELSVLPPGAKTGAVGRTTGSLLSGLVALATGQAADAPKPILVLSATRGFRHTACAYGKPILTRMGEQSGKFRVICSEDPRVINADFLKGMACVIFNNTTGSFLDDASKAALTDYVKNGGAFVGIHAATDCHYEWADYHDMIGGTFDGHPWSEKVSIRVEMPDFPACKGLPNPWNVGDEIYQQRDWSRDKICVLMSLDPKGTDLNKPGTKRADKDYGIAWVKPYGKGRVFYTALGHWEQVWDDPLYQGHLLNGVLWTMGEVEGECAPHPKPQ